MQFKLIEYLNNSKKKTKIICSTIMKFSRKNLKEFSTYQTNYTAHNSEIISIELCCQILGVCQFNQMKRHCFENDVSAKSQKQC